MSQNILRAGFFVALIAGASACAEVEEREYVYGTRLSEVEFNIVDPDQGVFPNASIRQHPDNPFYEGISLESAFSVQTLGPVPAFYGWAQFLTQSPYGEPQYWTAVAARDIYKFELADQDELVYARSIAIRGFQNCLNEFPDSTATYDATGNARYDLLVDVILGIQELGGEVPAGWSIADGPDGPIASYNGD